MSCISFLKRQLQKFGRILGKMSSTKNNKHYNNLNGDSMLQNFIIDEEFNEIMSGIHAGRQATLLKDNMKPDLSSSGYDSTGSFGLIPPLSSELPQSTQIQGYDYNLQNLCSSFGSIDLSNVENKLIPPSDPWESAPSPDSNYFQQTVDSSLFNFSNSQYSYSPLSSSSESYISNDSSYYSNMHYNLQQQQFFTHEFKYNEVDANNFQPCAVSTPFFERKIEQWDYNYYNLQPSNNFYHNSQFQQNQQVNQAQIKKVKQNKKMKVNKKSLLPYCVFCKNNGVNDEISSSHTVSDAKGRTLCPRLRLYKCPICGADGDYSHTMKYCPFKPIVTEEDLRKKKLPKRKNLLKF